MKLKTNKTVAKRFRLTATGKVMRQHGGQNHFNARDAGKVTRNKRRDEPMSSHFTKNIKILIGNI
jgi:large subunit ribosomal protein L35